MNSRRIDQTMLLIGVVLILISSYQLFWGRVLGSDSLALGKISAKKSVVKSRGVRGLDWQDALLNEPVSHNQLIYTDDNSSARISLNTGTVIDVEENSLIKIQQESNLETVNLEKGFINTKLSGNQPLRLKLGDQDIVLNSADALVQITQDGSSGEIGVLSGEVELTDGKSVQKIDQSQMVVLEGEKLSLKKIAYDLLSPGRGQKIFLKNESAQIDFAWTPEDEGEVSLQDMAGNSFSVEGKRALLPPGSYRWRVTSESGSSLESTFSVMKVHPPEVLRPKSGEKILLAPKEEEKGKLTLQWISSEEEVDVEWRLGSLRNSARTRESSLTVDLNSSGPFQWRVRNIYDDSKIEEWSPWQKIDVELLELPAIPITLAPAGVEFQFYKNEGWSVDLSWKSRWSSVIEIRSPDDKLFTQESITEDLKFNPQLAGEYQWRIRSRDDFGRRSGWSEWLNFTIKDLSQEKIKDAQRIQIERPNQEVEFSWEGGESESIFEISKDPLFKDGVLHRKVEGSSASVNIPDTGVYYWRSRRYLPDGKIEVNEPRKVIIEPNAAPLKPKALPDIEVPLEWKSVQSDLLEIFISSAHADEVEGEVKIELPQHQNAKSYIVRILSSSGKTMLTRELETPIFRWENAIPGEYQWQYAIKDFWGRQSEFSDPSRLVIKKPEIKRALLASPIRGQEVQETEIQFEWGIPKGVDEFSFEVARESDFKNVLVKSKLDGDKNSSKLSAELFSESGLYYWRILSIYPDGRIKKSSTGRFTLIKKESVPVEVKKDFSFPRRLVGILWTPSMDTYKFEDNSKEGEIEGQNILSTKLYGLSLGEKYYYAGSLCFSRGKVFEGEDYSSAQLSLSGGYRFQYKAMEFGAGITAGFLKSNTYSIQGSEVSSNSVNSLQYGPSLLGLIPLDETKSFMVTAAYMLGEVQEMQGSLDLLMSWKEYWLQGGVGISSRSFDENSGELSSLGLHLGIAKSF